jgi:hypothetical protein
MSLLVLESGMNDIKIDAGGLEVDRSVRSTRSALLPGISASAWRPEAEHAAEHGDLADMVAVVDEGLPEQVAERGGALGVLRIQGFDFAC